LKASSSDYQIIFEKSAEASGVGMGTIIESMPVYTIKAGDSTMWSLRFLGAFLPEAAKLLDRFTVRPSDDTLASIAESLRTGRFVESGRRCPPVHAPMSKVKTLLWLLVPLALVLVVLPVGVAYGEYAQCCEYYEMSAFDYIANEAYRLNGPILFGGLFALFVIVSEFAPGLLALRAEAKARRERNTI